MSLCEVCNKNDMVIHVTTLKGESMQLCRECNNKLTADYLGINLEPFQNGIYEYSGIRGKKHKFMINKIVHPMGIGYEALEVTGNGCPGFRVEVMAGLDCN